MWLRSTGGLWCQYVGWVDLYLLLHSAIWSCKYNYSSKHLLFGKYGKNFGRSRTYYDTQRKKKPTHFFGWQHNKEATFCEASLEYQFSRFLPTFSDTCVLSYVAMTYWNWVDNHTFRAVFICKNSNLLGKAHRHRRNIFSKSPKAFTCLKI